MTDPARASIGARRNPETESAVLDAAAAILAEEGYAKLTMEAVARRARAGKATVYRWWPGRGYLLLGLYTRSKESLPNPDTGSLRGDMVILVGALIAAWRGEGGAPPLAPLVRLLIVETQMDDSLRDAVEVERVTRWRALGDIFARAAARGEVNPALSPGDGERRFIAMFWYLLLNDRVPPSAEASALVDSLLADLLSPAARQSGD